MDKDMTEETEEVKEEASTVKDGWEPKDQKASISLSDIAFTVEVLKAASRRGAFELNELKNVGTLGERLQAFLDANAPKAETPTEEVVEDQANQGEEVVAEGAD
jgi:hypothetical protein